ncbi:SR-related and CTD-associated factor 8 [Mactra antiquata]
MEAVRAFNNELSSLYETKPPVSRAKMATLTKCAIKAIKFYKHVVQSVEKFIQKCKPEYKVPGLYVIDSVVRQSRHQFGSQKDVFAPRFTKNIITTFQNLFKCPGEERSKIVRVLNLWQKNDVFPSEIVQPLLDLAADPTKPALLAAAQAAVDKVLAASGKGGSHPPQQQHGAPSQQHGESGDQNDTMNQATAESMIATQNDMLNTVTQLLQQSNSFDTLQGNTSLSAQQQQLQQLQLLQQQLIQQTALMQQPTGGPPLIDANLLAQIQALTNQLLQKSEMKPDEGFNKKLLDFDYGESDDEEDRRHSSQGITGDVQNILNDSGLMQQIHQVSQSIQRNNEYSELTEQEKRRRILEQQQAEFDQQIAQDTHQQPPPVPFSAPPPMPGGQYPEEGEFMEEAQDEDFRDHQQFRDRDDRDRRDRRRRSRDRSRSRTPKRRRRSRSRDRRRRSRSRDRSRRSKSRDRERKEKERERKKKGLPAVRSNFITVCTTTIWIGHLNKFTSEEELKNELEHYGPVETINMVPPRGCAYVVMENRKDAFKAIDRLKGTKLNGSALKTAWAQSTSIRESAFKESWDVDEGAIYIPWDSVPKDLSFFLEGGIIDAMSLPEHLKDIATERVKLELNNQPELQPQENQVPPNTVPQQPNTTGQPQQHIPPPMTGQPPMMGMMPNNMPPMPGMLPGMMMPMQRPVVPGMPPQPMQLTPGGPPMLPPGSQVPGLPSVRPPGAAVLPPMPAMSMPSLSAANSLAQTIENIMSTTAGVIPSSPSIPRPSFTPGAPPRFGFNPAMPPPGFRLPPPGFGSPLRPMMGMPPTSKPGDVTERPPAPAGQGPKQPEMMWPPDSNEKDEDLDEDEDLNEDRSEIIRDNAHLPGQLGQSISNQPPPPGQPDQSPVRMLAPPGGFPPGGHPGPVNQPWTMRLGGPRLMRPPMGGPDIFGSPMAQRMGGPRGAPMMNSPGGFPRFGPRGPGVRGPVSLLDLDLKPKDTFAGETFNKSDQSKEGDDDKNDDSAGDGDDESRQSGSRNNDDRKRDRSGGRDRSHRGRDDDRERDDRGFNRRDRDRHRDHGRSRDYDKDRSWDRDRDRDWRRRDDHREDRPERSERDRSRKSRWSNNDDVQPNNEANVSKDEPSEAQSDTNIVSSESFGFGTSETTGGNNTSENVPENAESSVNEIVNTNSDSTSNVEPEPESSNNIVDGPVTSDQLEEGETIENNEALTTNQGETTEDASVPNDENSNLNETAVVESNNASEGIHNNGPVTDAEPDIPPETNDSIVDNSENIDKTVKDNVNPTDDIQNVEMDLEEGEISS